MENTEHVIHSIHDMWDIKWNCLILSDIIWKLQKKKKKKHITKRRSKLVDQKTSLLLMEYLAIRALTLFWFSSEKVKQVEWHFLLFDTCVIQKWHALSATCIIKRFKRHIGDANQHRSANYWIEKVPLAMPRARSCLILTVRVP